AVVARGRPVRPLQPDPGGSGHALERLGPQHLLGAREQLALLEAHVGGEAVGELADGLLVARRGPRHPLAQLRMIVADPPRELARAGRLERREQPLLLHAEVGLDLGRELGLELREALPGAAQIPRQHQRLVVVGRQVAEPRVALHGAHPRAKASTATYSHWGDTPRRRIRRSGRTGPASTVDPTCSYQSEEDAGGCQAPS